MKSPLKGSVGKNGLNQSTDTKLVQMLLNDWLGRCKKNLLKVDGIVGPKTIAAITEFQSSCKILSDGRVDANGATLRHLTSLHFLGLRSGLLASPLNAPYPIFAGFTAPAPPPSIQTCMEIYLETLYKALKK